MRHLNERVALCTVLCGFFVVMLDTTIVNVSLPYIGKDLGGTTSSLQWVVDSYTLSFAALLLTSGTACDRERKRTRLNYRHLKPSSMPSSS